MFDEMTASNKDINSALLGDGLSVPLPLRLLLLLG